jgi:membrane protease YdiL (CAAX protease family)
LLVGPVLLVDHLLAVVLVVIGPLRSGTVGLRRLRRAEPQTLSQVRRSVYRNAMLVLWALSVIVLLVWVVAGRDARALGLAFRPNAGLIGGAVGAVIMTVVLWRHRAAAIADPEALAEVRRRMGHLELMLPHDRVEWRPFWRLAITAGLCEELLYRGYLTWYFSHVVSWWPAGLLAALAFGLGHAYQGPRGILMTGIVGAFLFAMYAFTGSLFVSMALHALMDLHSGHLALRAYEQRQREEAVEAEAAADELWEGGHAP